MRLPIILDTDPGIDDAAAIAAALFAPELDLQLMTTVAGNVSVEKTTRNALQLLHFWNADVPLAQGASMPLVRPLRDAASVHGESGMEGYDFVEHQRQPLAKPAFQAIRDALMHAAEPITLVAIGPLTNIALLLTQYPECVFNIRRLVIMGGSAGRGNFTPNAEFNIAIDPEAAAKVFHSGLEIVMCGLDVTNRALLGIIVAAIFVLLSQLTVMSLAGYVYPNVYGSAAAQSTASLLGTVIMLIVCAPFASKLAAKFGKKELAVASSICSALVWLVCLIWRPASVWGFVACYILANVGMGFFNTIIWAMITDVIDDAEVRSGIREDGTIYSVYSFARKLGQAFSSGLVGALLGIIGYTEATAFDPAVTRGIFNMACIAPIIGFVCIVLALVFLYPLNKKKVEENVAALAARRNSK